MRKILVSLLWASLALTGWAADSAPGLSGSGTATDPYLIASKADLLTLQTLCSDQGSHFAGVSFRQTADIDMAQDTAFYGIGASKTYLRDPEATAYFSGSYDGGGHTIKGLNICHLLYGQEGRVSFSSPSNVGLFGTLGQGASVTGVNIDATSRITGFSAVGGIAGYMQDGSSVSDCTVAAQITAYNNNAGGIVGSAHARRFTAGIAITRCRFTGRLTGDGFNYGGIVGMNYGLVQQCVNDGEVLAIDLNPINYDDHRIVGGIAGDNRGSVRNCVNTGHLLGKAQTGGIVGFNTSALGMGSVQACLNLGRLDVEQREYAGAVVGRLYILASATNGNQLVANNYYDWQLCPYYACNNVADPGVEPLLTRQITAGEALAGLDTAVWRFKAGHYPMLKAFDDDYEDRVTAAYIVLPDKERANDFRTTATVSTARADLAASLLAGDRFTLGEGRVTAPAVTGLSRDTVRLALSDCVRLIPVCRLINPVAGIGTAADPYQIATAAQFLAIAQGIEQTGVGYAGETFKVTAPLDFTGCDFQPFGSYDNRFEGTFDGAGHTIAHVTDTVTTTRHLTHVGLIGALGTGGVVRNVRLSHSRLQSNNCVGGIVGCNYGTVTDVTVDSTCQIAAVYQRNTALNSTTYPGTAAGGIVGEMHQGARVQLAQNFAPVTGNDHVGGIVGTSVVTVRSVEGSTITRCQNHGAITATAPKTTQRSTSGTTDIYPDARVGGIAGSFRGLLDSCANHATVTATQGCIAGGIVGYQYRGTTVSHALNTHAVSCPLRYYAGGIVGTTESYASLPPRIVDCANTGTITGLSRVAGILAHAGAGTVIARCSNEGTIQPQGNYAAGIVGELMDNGVAVSDCWNGALVHGSGHVGGIAANAGSYALTVNRCFNVGEVRGGFAAGGTAGIANGKAQITNCYNAGLVNAYKQAGAINGMPVSGARVTAAYNVGTDTVMASTGYATAHGNVFGYEVKNVAASRCYYWHGLPTGPVDTAYQIAAVSAPQLFALSDSLGSEWVNQTYCFPMLRGMETLDAARACASYFNLAQGDDAQHVSRPIELAPTQGVTWTGGGVFRVNGLTAQATAEGDGTLTVTAGRYVRTYALHATQATSGVSEPQAAKVPVSVTYYNLQGRPSATPFPGVNIVVTRYTDGSTQAAKVLK